MECSENGNYVNYYDYTLLEKRCEELENELCDYKTNHNTQRWNELLNKRMDQIKSLEARLAEAVSIIDRLLVPAGAHRNNGGGVKLFDAVKSARDFLSTLPSDFKEES